MSAADEATVHQRLSQVCRDMISLRIPLPHAKARFEDQFLNEALLQVRGNVSKAADVAGVHRNTIHNKLRGRR